MDQRTRLPKTLGCLVASMTAGTALLSWIEPAGLPASDRPGPLLLAQPAARAIHTHFAIRSGRWKAILVQYRSGPRPESVPHEPLAGQEAFHFVVRPDGYIQASALWENQGVTRPTRPGQGDVLRVCVVGSSSDDAEMPQAQWNGLVALVQQLKAKCHIPPDKVSLAKDSGRGRHREPPAQVERLRELLVSAGVTR